VTATLRTRRPVRLTPGPALARRTVPLGTTALSAVIHLALLGALLAGAALWPAPPKPYVVNLVPAVAAIGTPQARLPSPTPRATAPAPRPPEPAPPPPRAAEPPPPAAPRPPAELPQREAPREMPAREPARAVARLPEPSLPAPQPAPRPAPAEARPLPGPPAPPAPRAPEPAALPSRAPAAPPAPPPSPGQPSGVAHGAGTVTIDATSDFAYAWYIAAMSRKINERWDPRAMPGQQPRVTIQIARDGQVVSLRVERSSGNAAYDQAALRSVSEANPLPPLPDDWKKPNLTVTLQFRHEALVR
jgi:protein TonB